MDGLWSSERERRIALSPMTAVRDNERETERRRQTEGERERDRKIHRERERAEIILHN